MILTSKVTHMVKVIFFRLPWKLSVYVCDPAVNSNTALLSAWYFCSSSVLEMEDNLWPPSWWIKQNIKRPQSVKNYSYITSAVTYRCSILDPVSKLVLPVPKPLGGQNEVGLDHWRHCGQTAHTARALGHRIKTDRGDSSALIDRETVKTRQTIN